ncbi:MAG: DUF6745 domain-containing protein [Candidatus Binatia bacterium]
MNRNIPRSVPSWRLGSGSGAESRGYRTIAYGQADARWLAVADFFATAFGNKHCQKPQGLLEAMASCGTIWIKPDKVFICDRPKFAKFDERGNLNCEDGAALEYRDGTGFFYLNGVPVFKQYIETPADQLNLEDVLKLDNAAMRMAVMQKFGFTRLLATARHRLISEANGNSLIEFKLGAKPPFEYLRALRVKWQDKTGAKETILQVPRLRGQFGADRPENINDCEHVRRWTLGWPKEALAVAET